MLSLFSLVNFRKTRIIPKKTTQFLFLVHIKFIAGTYTIHSQSRSFVRNSIDLLNRHHHHFLCVCFSCVCFALFSLLILDATDAYAYILIFIHSFPPQKKYYCFCFWWAGAARIPNWLGFYFFYSRLIFFSHRLQDVITDTHTVRQWIWIYWTSSTDRKIYAQQKS